MRAFIINPFHTGFSASSPPPSTSSSLEELKCSKKQYFNFQTSCASNPFTLRSFVDEVCYCLGDVALEAHLGSLEHLIDDDVECEELQPLRGARFDRHGLGIGGKQSGIKRHSRLVGFRRGLTSYLLHYCCWFGFEKPDLSRISRHLWSKDLMVITDFKCLLEHFTPPIPRYERAPRCPLLHCWHLG